MAVFKDPKRGRLRCVSGVPRLLRFRTGIDLVNTSAACSVGAVTAGCRVREGGRFEVHHHVALSLLCQSVHLAGRRWWWVESGAGEFRGGGKSEKLTGAEPSFFGAVHQVCQG